MKLPNIVVRILAGAVFVSLLVGGILCNEYTFAIIFSLITFLALFEFNGLIAKQESVQVSKIKGSIGGVILFAGTYLYVSLSNPLGLLLYALYVLIVFIGELYLKKGNPIKSLAYFSFGQIYIAVPFSLLPLLAFGYEGNSYHWVYILAILVFIWVNDSFAYLTGMAFGKHRLFERISPKKSWEGFIGGAIFAVGSSLVFAHFFEKLSMMEWMGFAAVVVAFGTWGDLIESLIKRTLGVKDSGNMIPGHGGILDRFDSTILAIPAIFIYLEILNYFASI